MTIFILIVTLTSFNKPIEVKSNEFLAYTSLKKCLSMKEFFSRGDQLLVVDHKIYVTSFKCVKDK